MKIHYLIIPVFIVLFAVYVDSLRDKVSSLDYIGNKINIDTSSCSIEYEKDTHGGFHGDGDYFVRMNCSDMNDNSIISNWNELPLSDEINKTLNIKSCGKKECQNVSEKYKIPDIQDGYYYFIDRSPKIDDSNNLYDKIIYNYTIAIFDNSTKIIYFYELDT